eukprot:15291533-Ditylum_brightwellii.AAC.1
MRQFTTAIVPTDTSEWCTNSDKICVLHACWGSFGHCSCTVCVDGMVTPLVLPHIRCSRIYICVFVLVVVLARIYAGSFYFLP